MLQKSRYCSCGTDIGREEYLPICKPCHAELTATAKRICAEARKEADERIAQMNAELYTHGRKDPKPVGFFEGFVAGFVTMLCITILVAIIIEGARNGQETKTKSVPRAEVFGSAEKDTR